MRGTARRPCSRPSAWASCTSTDPDTCHAPSRRDIRHEWVFRPIRFGVPRSDTSMGIWRAQPSEPFVHHNETREIPHMTAIQFVRSYLESKTDERGASLVEYALLVA